MAYDVRRAILVERLQGLALDLQLEDVSQTLAIIATMEQALAELKEISQ